MSSYEVPCPRCHDERCAFVTSYERHTATCVRCGHVQGAPVAPREQCPAVHVSTISMRCDLFAGHEGPHIIEDLQEWTRDASELPQVQRLRRKLRRLGEAYRRLRLAKALGLRSVGATRCYP